jgi:phosphopantothenoylcysteine decarboxylase/phosphopantothenate--cysteine ligase
MHCLITAGPTYEPLDEVRRLINFSSGRLGSELANHLVSRGHRVTLLLGHQATWRGECQAQETINFSTTADLRRRLQGFAGRSVEAVFHAAAVSDFAFGKVWRRLASGDLEEIAAGKISSRAGPLLAELVSTPKIISELRDWFPEAWLAGWKYEVDGNQADAIAEAEKQIAASRTDACIANGRAYGRGFGLVTGPGKCLHLDDAHSLFVALGESLN